MVEHKLQLCAIIGHIICFATDEVRTTLTNAEDLFCNQFGLLCLAAGLEQVARHHVGGFELQISGLLGLRRHLNRRSGLFRLLIDGPKAAVIGEIKGGKGGLVAEIDMISAGTVGLGDTTELYLGNFPGDLVLLCHVLQTEILLGIHSELSGHDLGAVGRDLDLNLGSGQAIGETIVEVVANGDLLHVLCEGGGGEKCGENREWENFHWNHYDKGNHGWLRQGRWGQEAAKLGYDETGRKAKGRPGGDQRSTMANRWTQGSEGRRVCG